MAGKRICHIVIFVLCILIILVLKPGVKARADWNDAVVPGRFYEFEKNEDYDFKDKEPVNIMSFGKSSLGTLIISGYINDITQYNGYTAYGALSGMLSFSYNYDGYLLDKESETHLETDKATELMGQDIKDKIQKGVLLVQKSFDGKTWENACNPVVNFFETKPSGAERFYRTDGNDVALGIYYRIVVAYKSVVEKTEENKSFWPWISDTNTFRNMEVYELYVCRNVPTISIHDLANDNMPIETDEYTIESIRKAETLIDGSVTTKGFSIDKLGTSFDVTVNGVLVSDGAKYTESGKYTIITKTKLGQQDTKTVYIFTGDNDRGYRTYFGDSFVQGKRIFNDSLDYPAYARDAKVRICQISEITPILVGKITNITNGEKIEINLQNRKEILQDLSVGEYYAEFVTGKSDYGSFYRYCFRFYILDEDSGPRVNYSALTSSDRLSNLISKHYEVAYPTTYGGYIYVCFASYDDAFAYAYEIEKRYVEKTSDGTYYYKSPDNPNQKILYQTESDMDKINLTYWVNYYAEQNVEISYFNQSEQYTYQTFESEEILLDSLETLSLPKSMKVFPSKEEQEKMVQSIPFVNGFKFIHVDDYDVKTVIAQCDKDGKIYNIDFDTKVEFQLGESSVYTITETNMYGDEKPYQVCFMNHNNTESKWKITENGENEEKELVLGVGREYKVDSAILVESINDLDEGAIVKIEAPNVYDFEITCGVNELAGIVLYKKGKYKLTYVDRVDNTYTVIFDVSGIKSYSEVAGDGNRCFTDVYNDIYIKDKDYSQEINVK